MEDKKSAQDMYCKDSSLSSTPENVWVEPISFPITNEEVKSDHNQDHQISPTDVSRSEEKVALNNIPDSQEMSIAHVLPTESLPSSGEAAEKYLQVSETDGHQEMLSEAHAHCIDSMSSSGEIVEKDDPISAIDVSKSMETVTTVNSDLDLQEAPIKSLVLPTESVTSSGEVGEKDLQVMPISHVLPMHSSSEVAENIHQISPSDVSKSVDTITIPDHQGMPIEGQALPEASLSSSSEFAGKDHHQISPTDVSRSLETAVTVNDNPDHQGTPIEAHIIPAGSLSSSSEFAEKDQYAPDASSTTPAELSDHKEVDINRGFVDTDPPIESVKEAVSKFGGIVDWKAHRMQTAERRSLISRELERVQKEIPAYRKHCEEAEDAKALVLKELESTKKLVDELKLSLERAQTEEHQAKQDSELALLRVEELEHGIADESSVAAKAQLDVAKSRHEAAVSELSMAKHDLETLRMEYASLITEKEVAVQRAEEAVSASKEIEKTVEDLMIELIVAKECLESAHAAHLEAEEQKIGVAMAREQDSLIWEKELKQAEEELGRLNQKIVSSNDLKSKLDTASTLLLDLKAELAAYMESKETTGVDDSNPEDTKTETRTKTRADIEASVASARKELEEMRANIEKSTEEVNSLKETSTSLKSELESQKASLAAIKQREGMASIAAASLESELSKTKTEIALAQSRERESREKMVELPKQLQQASEEADLAKSLAQAARDEMCKAKEEADHAKISANAVVSRVVAAQKEIEAARASECLALAAIKALKESETAENTHLDSSSNSGITLSLEEYYNLSKRAQEAEENANARVSAAMEKIEVAREAELETLKRLEAAEHDMDAKRTVLENAKEKAEKATAGKLGVEQELRKWRSEHKEQRKKVGYSGPLAVVNPLLSPGRSVDENKESKDVEVVGSNEKPNQTAIGTNEKSLESDCMEEKVAKKKKKSFFPRILMFLARRKARASKTA